MFSSYKKKLELFCQSIVIALPFLELAYCTRRCMVHKALVESCNEWVHVSIQFHTSVSETESVWLHSLQIFEPEGMNHTRVLSSPVWIVSHGEEEPFR